MATSIAAEQVANDVLLEVGNGRIPNKEEIQLKHGYSPVSARKGKAIQTKTYKRVMKPVIQMLEEERLAILERMRETRDEAKYRDLSNALGEVTKTHQLLSGGATENIAIGGVNIYVRKNS